MKYLILFSLLGFISCENNQNNDKMNYLQEIDYSEEQQIEMLMEVDTL